MKQRTVAYPSMSAIPLFFFKYRLSVNWSEYWDRVNNEVKQWPAVCVGIHLPTIIHVARSIPWPDDEIFSKVVGDLVLA